MHSLQLERTANQEILFVALAITRRMTPSRLHTLNYIHTRSSAIVGIPFRGRKGKGWDQILFEQGTCPLSHPIHKGCTSFTLPFPKGLHRLYEGSVIKTVGFTMPLITPCKISLHGVIQYYS